MTIRGCSSKKNTCKGKGLSQTCCSPSGYEDRQGAMVPWSPGSTLETPGEGLPASGTGSEHPAWGRGFQRPRETDALGSGPHSTWTSVRFHLHVRSAPSPHLHGLSQRPHGGAPRAVAVRGQEGPSFRENAKGEAVAW